MKWRLQHNLFNLRKLALVKARISCKIFMRLTIQMWKERIHRNFFKWDENGNGEKNNDTRIIIAFKTWRFQMWGLSHHFQHVCYSAFWYKVLYRFFLFFSVFRSNCFISCIKETLNLHTRLGTTWIWMTIENGINLWCHVYNTLNQFLSQIKLWNFEFKCVNLNAIWVVYVFRCILCVVGQIII
jgi:hypothetical protein